MKAIQANIGGVAVYIQAEDVIEAEPPDIEEPAVEEPDGYEGADFETMPGPSGLTFGGGGRKPAKPKTADNQGETQGAKAADTKDAFEKAANLVSGLAEGLKEKFKNPDNRPAELEIEYSLTVGAKAEIVVVKAKAESIFKVRMLWRSKE